MRSACGRDGLLPAPIAFSDLDRPFRMAEHVLFGIDDLSDELAEPGRAPW